MKGISTLSTLGKRYDSQIAVLDKSSKALWHAGDFGIAGLALLCLTPPMPASKCLNFLNHQQLFIRPVLQGVLLANDVRELWNTPALTVNIPKNQKGRLLAAVFRAFYVSGHIALAANALSPGSIASTTVTKLFNGCIYSGAGLHAIALFNTAWKSSVNKRDADHKRHELAATALMIFCDLGLYWGVRYHPNPLAHTLITSAAGVGGAAIMGKLSNDDLVRAKGSGILEQIKFW